MLETLGEFPDRFRELTGNGVSRACRGSGVMRLIQDEQGSCAKFAEDIAQARGIGLICKSLDLI